MASPLSRGNRRRARRDQTADGTWEVWLSDQPEHALEQLGRWHSLLVYAALWVGARG